MPTPKTHELVRVVVNVAVGAPDRALADLVAPIAPDPLLPEVSTPVKLTTVRDAVAARDILAVTDTLVSGVDANARQISEVPRCAFVRITSCQVKPAPVTLVTVLEPLEYPAETNANTNSLGEAVENALVVTVVCLEDD